ncbi:uncharacterized protein LOC114350003 [Ostrinia furnacalis]|uniref:uncharacterized protein LOC114350003 n=1 Tax=Ostrinia furnacalis TaxID=93504 RepID=UPI001039D6DD|nr:uncharacterized protein LOC114350003 [Ostrinia furnacalis]
MSEEMALGDNVSSDDAKVNGDEAEAASAVEAEAPPSEAPPEPEEPPAEDKPAEESAKDAVDEADSKQELDEKPDVKEEQSDVNGEKADIKDEKPDINDEIPDVNGEKPDIKNEQLDIKDEKPNDDAQESDQAPNDAPADQNDAAGDRQDMDVDKEADQKRGLKRRASIAFSDAGDDEFVGFELPYSSDLSRYNSVLERLEAEVSAASKSFTPVRHVMATPPAPVRASKRARQDTDGSRPSSALSSRSDGDGTVSTEVASSPLNRGRRATIEMSSPLLRVPLERGWKRELVYRAALDAHSRRNADIYYYTPQGKKLRSTREVSEQLSGTGLTLENFSFFKEPLGVDDPEKEIIRDAKLMRRGESPVSAPAVPEGKRAPKPKPPKGASPEPTPKSPPAKLRVKSMGSRLNNSNPPASPAPAPSPATKAKKPADNNNSAAWKKPSGEKRQTRMVNGSSPPPVTSPRRRGRPKQDTDHFTAFYHKAQEHNYNVVVQIFQYLGMRDLAHCARVCKLWRQMASTPALWRHVRMKNSHVSDWGGLCTALKRHGTKWLDLRKMLLPQNDTVFWEQFAQHISTVDTIERIELCRCPARAVEAVCAGLPGLVALSALAIRSPALDPAPLARLPRLRELRLKSMAGLALARDLRPLASLEHLAHLSLTSIKELGWCACDVIGQLSQLESLELGECTFRAEFAGVLAKLARLRRLRLERGTAQCAAPALLRALAALPLLTRLELVNIDVKVGFDDALAECKNIQRLLIIPTYVSQSATTNKQVLSGVLRLKDTLTHLMWGVTIELLRVTELFIDQCEQAPDSKRRDVGECIPVLKPVPGCKLPDEHQHVAGPPQVEILPLPTLQRLLAAQLPHTRLKLLRIPFHATWRQSLADFQ